MDKLEKAINILGIIVIIAMLIFAIWFVIEFKEMLNDHRCYNLPLDEFYQDEKCERYWDFREWKN